MPAKSTKPKRTKLDTISPALKDLLDQAIQRGESAAKLCMWLKQEHNVGVAEETMRRYMARFLNSRLDQGINELRKYLDELPGKADAVKALADAIVVQQARIGFMLKKEKQDEKTSSATDKALLVLNDLCVNLAKIEMDMGIRKCVQRTAAGNTGGSNDQIVDVLKTAMNKVREKEAIPATDVKPAGNDGQPAVTTPV